MTQIGLKWILNTTFKNVTFCRWDLLYFNLPAKEKGKLSVNFQDKTPHFLQHNSPHNPAKFTRTN